MNSFAVPPVPTLADIPNKGFLYPTDACDPADPNRMLIEPGPRSMPYIGHVSPTVAIVEYINEAGLHTGKSFFVHSSDLTNIRPVPPQTVSTGLTQADVDSAVSIQKVADSTAQTAAVNAAVKAAVDPLTAQIAGLNNQLAAQKNDLAGQAATINSQSATIANLRTQLAGENLATAVQQAKVASLQSQLGAQAQAVATGNAVDGLLASIKRLLHIA